MSQIGAIIARDAMINKPDLYWQTPSRILREVLVVFGHDEAELRKLNKKKLWEMITGQKNRGVKKKEKKLDWGMEKPDQPLSW